MELPIICPLCSQLGFPDVNSLWLNLIRAATRHLACPVCQEILCGLDKLTIHLVSHLLQDQVPQTYFTSNISSSYVGCSRNPESQILNEPVLAASLQHHDVVKDSTPMASYVVINFPSLQNLAVDNSGQLKLAEYSSVIEGEKSTSAAPSSVANFSTSPNANLSECGTTTVATQNQVTGSKFMCASNTMHTDEPVITSSHPRVKLEEGSNLNDGLIVPTENDGSRQRNIEETEYIGTVPSNLLCESESKPKSSFDNFVPDTSGPVVKCGVCHLVFKDNSILLLHQQLVHNSKTCNDSQHQMSPKNDERGLTPRPSPSKSKRGSIASQNRDAAASLHRFPCHVCNKVFRMRGSLMVHLRVAHSPSGAIGLSARLDSTVSFVMSQQGDDVSCKLLQNLSIKEADLVTGKNLNSTGFNVGQINEQFEFSGGACSTLNPQVSSVHDQSSSVSKRTSMETVNSCSPLISSVASIESPANTPIESLGIVFPCTLCNKSFSKEVLLAQHCKSHDSKQWKCDVCFKLFTTKYFLKKHKRLHTGEMPYTCVICNKSFTFQQSYHKHLLYHSDEKPHSCADCGRAFKELSTLHNHQRIHTGEKPWACETCGKCFRQRVSYLVHRRIHTGAMPYQCNVCLKSFRYKVSQRTHKCTVQQDSAGVPLSADHAHPKSSCEKESADILSAMPAGSSEDSATTVQEHTSVNMEHNMNLQLSVSNTEFPSGSNNLSLNNDTIPPNPNSEIRSDVCAQHQLTDSTVLCRDTETTDYNEFILSNLFRSEPLSKAAEINNLKPSLKVNLEKDCSAPLNHENFITTHSTSCVSQCSPAPSAPDFSLDLLQDILSMVMSPASNNVPSPSTQMRHLSLSDSRNDDDSNQALNYGGSCMAQLT